MIDDGQFMTAAGLTRRAMLKQAGGMAVALFGASGLLAACSQVVPATQPAVALKVQVGIQNVEFAGMYEADQQGYLKAESVTQELLATGPNVAPVPVVAGGGANLGVLGGADSLIKARAGGVPVKVFGVLLQKAPSGLVSLAANPIKTPKDAVGKRVGLQAGARGPWSTILQLNGLNENQMTIVPVEASCTRKLHVAALGLLIATVDVSDQRPARST